MERAKQQREKCCGVLHPETNVSIFYNQVHILFLLYMLAFLPVRTAFQITPTPDDWAFWVDLFIDLAIVLDIVLNFRCATCQSSQLICWVPHTGVLATTVS